MLQTHTARHTCTGEMSVGCAGVLPALGLLPPISVHTVTSPAGWKPSTKRVTLPGAIAGLTSCSTIVDARSPSEHLSPYPLRPWTHALVRRARRPPRRAVRMQSTQTHS
jgi:hypothetical protein